MALKALLTSPGTSLMWVFRTIHEAVETEIDQERDAIRAQLNELYHQVESGELDEDEFDELEEELLDRLDELDELLGGEA